MQSSPSTLTLKLSTNRSSSSASVEAPGSSIWIQSAPSPISASRFGRIRFRSEEHTSELQSHSDLVCRLLLEKKKNHTTRRHVPRVQPLTVHTGDRKRRSGRSFS